MPRANRYFLSGYVWHITHRCHKQSFLLKFAKDKRRWRYWLFEAKKRYGLSVLNYIITSNHIHLLVRDQGRGEIAKSMQLIAGRTAQEYNRRKDRKGAFWEDRYHATAIDTDTYLGRCMAYVDLNMVRAGVVSKPEHWCWGGYNEIQLPLSRYAVIDIPALLEIFGTSKLNILQSAHRDWINEARQNSSDQNRPEWSRSLAVGSPEYLDRVRAAFGHAARARSVVALSDAHVLMEASDAYKDVYWAENTPLSLEYELISGE